MSETNIGWTDRVWNPVTGCSKVSEGCRNCYAEAISLRYGRSQHPWSAAYAAENVVLHPERLTVPLSWKKPSYCFVNSMSDLFHERVPDEFIDRVFAVMALASRHTFQVLTKRPERMAAWFSERFQIPHWDGTIGWESRSGRVFEAMQDFTDPANDDHFDADGNFIWPGCPLPNVWLGTSVENQQAADTRIPHLLATPAAVRFLSCEPLLGPVELGQWQTEGVYVNALTGEYIDGDRTKKVSDGIQWVIVGGESGPNHRPMDLDWLRGIVDQCRVAGVPVFVKQDSGRYPGRQGRIPDDLWVQEYPASPAGSRQEALL